MTDKFSEKPGKQLKMAKKQSFIQSAKGLSLLSSRITLGLASRIRRDQMVTSRRLSFFQRFSARHHLFL